MSWMPKNWAKWWSCPVVACLLAVNASGLYAQDDKAEKAEERRSQTTQEQEIEIVVETEADEDAKVVDDLRVPSAGYWIGVRLAPIAEFELVRSQLGIDAGVVAVSIVEDGPAAKAGLKRHDIVVRFDGKAVKDVSSLVKQIGEIKETEVDAVVLRGGKETTLKITPQERPELSEIDLPKMDEFRARIDEFRKQIEGRQTEGQGLILKIESDEDGKGGVRMIRIEPRVLLGKRFGGDKLALPKDLSIKIEKNGEEPAKIHVKSSDGEWNVSEDDLKELPETIRVYVETFMGDSELEVDGAAISQRVLEAVQQQLKNHPRGEGWQKRVQSILKSVESGFETDDTEDDDADDVKEELKRLRREVEELRKRQQEKSDE